MNEEEYKKAFGLPVNGQGEDLKKVEKALEHALDIRKFEIVLYWQRATYFWALIAVAFAGYFAVLGAEHLMNKEFLAFLLSCIGLIFTWAWFQVNRGSKYWQENWENHVDMLEDEITGPLYKTVLRRPEDTEIKERVKDKCGLFLEMNVTGPAAISASKINQLVSTFILLIWFCLIMYSITETVQSTVIVIGEIVIGLITLGFFLLLYKGARTYGGELEHVAKKRGAKIVDP